MSDPLGWLGSLCEVSRVHRWRDCPVWMSACVPAGRLEARRLVLSGANLGAWGSPAGFDGVLDKPATNQWSDRARVVHFVFSVSWMAWSADVASLDAAWPRAIWEYTYPNPQVAYPGGPVAALPWGSAWLDSDRDLFVQLSGANVRHGHTKLETPWQLQVGESLGIVLSVGPLAVGDAGDPLPDLAEPVFFRCLLHAKSKEPA